MRLLLTVALAVVALAPSLACRGEQQAPGTSTPEAADSVKLALDWFPNSNHAGIYEAAAKNYFRESGLEVEVYTPSDPASILQTVGAGRDDFGISYQPDLLQARSEGLPVVAIAAIVQHPLNSVMTLKSSGIESPQQLKGKKVGWPSIPSNRGMLEEVLQKDGLSINDVELVDVGFDLVPALLSGTVDAIVGAYWTHESILMELEGHPVNIMRLEQWGVPDYYELVLVASETTVANRKDLVRRFVDAFSRGFESAQTESPEVLVRQLMDAAPEAVNREVELKGVDLLRPMWKGSAPRFGWQEADRWSSFASWMKSKSLIRQDLDATKAFTNEFVQAR